MHPAPSSLWQMSTCAMHLSTCYYLTYTWNEKLHPTWKDIIKSSRPSEKEKPVGGIFGGVFPDTDQLHHLTGLDPSCHLLGQKNALQSPLTPLHYKTGRVNTLPFKTWMCLSISLFTSTSWGTLGNPAGRKRDKEHILHEITKH